MLEVIRILCLYPTVTPDGMMHDGLRLPQPKICQKCKLHDCWSYVAQDKEGRLVHATCSRGLSVVLCQFNEGKIVCNGIIVKTINTACPSEIRKRYKPYRVAWEELVAWHKSASNALPVFEETSVRHAQEAIHGLHDVKTAVSLVTRNAEAIIASLPGDTDEERIDNADDGLKALLKSVQLLHTRLSASSILANPEAASHGQKHPTPIHKVCFKMVRLFEELAGRKRCRVRMVGSSYATPLCYDSFETIPLVLIDNAVKYSSAGKDIVVTVQDHHTHVLLEVESHGPVVPEGMRNAIFQQGTRGPDSSRLVSRGSGLGLHIASIVARAQWGSTLRA